jgi:hypothetical protein
MNRKKVILAVLFGISSMALLGQRTMSFPKAKITLHVTDQNGRPVEAARVGIGGTLNPRSDEAAKGLTSQDGTFPAEVRSNGEVGITARKEGYYDTFGPDYNFRNLKGAMERAFATDRWEPWNLAVQVMLKKILNPTPMYARRINRPIPTRGESVAFDFFEGDYVAPHGRGKTADMVFKLNINEAGDNDYDYKLAVTFSNTLDGILPFTVERYPNGSGLRSPHLAPENGLLPEWTVTRSRRPGSGEKSNYDPETHAYFFRVRTVVDSNGKIISANYGKIYGDFMNFTYYLNPTPNDRNVEFDPKRNLFTNLKDEERVTAP